MRRKFFVRIWVLVFKLDGRGLFVSREVKVGAICQPVEFLAPEREVKLKVDGALAVVGAVSVRHLQFVNGALRNTHRLATCMHPFVPLLKPLLPLLRPHKIFYLHLFELTYAEDKVARRDFVAESLPYLADAERQFWVERINHVFKVHKYSAGGLRPQVRDGCLLSGSDRRAEHGVKARAVRHRVGEAAHVSACLPRARVHDDCRIKAVHIITLLHEHAPPKLLDIVFEFNSGRPVSPGAGDPAVNFGALIYKPPALAQRHYFFHQSFFFFVRHSFVLLFWRNNVHTIAEARLKKPCSWSLCRCRYLHLRKTVSTREHRRAGKHRRAPYLGGTGVKLYLEAAGACRQTVSDARLKVAEVPAHRAAAGIVGNIAPAARRDKRDIGRQDGRYSRVGDCVGGIFGSPLYSVCGRTFRARRHGALVAEAPGKVQRACKQVDGGSERNLRRRGGSHLVRHIALTLAHRADRE